MKVRITLTVDIDPESWEMNYGTGYGLEGQARLAAIREDVRRYCESTVVEQLLEVGVNGH